MYFGSMFFLSVPDILIFSMNHGQRLIHVLFNICTETSPVCIAMHPTNARHFASVIHFLFWAHISVSRKLAVCISIEHMCFFMVLGISLNCSVDFNPSEKRNDSTFSKNISYSDSSSVSFFYPLSIFSLPVFSLLCRHSDSNHSSTNAEQPISCRAKWKRMWKITSVHFMRPYNLHFGDG